MEAKLMINTIKDSVCNRTLSQYYEHYNTDCQFSLQVYTQSLHSTHTIPQGHRWSLFVIDHHHPCPVDQSKCEQPTHNITYTSIIMMEY